MEKGTDEIESLPQAIEEDGQAKSEAAAAAERLAWMNSIERRKGRNFSIILDSLGSGAFFLLGFMGWRAARLPFDTMKIDWHIEGPYIIAALTCISLTWTASIVAVKAKRQEFHDRRLIERRTLLEGAEAKLAYSGDLGLARLWVLTQQRLDYYHQIATDHATQSFRNAQIAMGAGFIVLLSSIGFALSAKTTVESIVIGSLGGLGATLASYVGRTFVRSQESTAKHLQSYFTQPLEFSRFLAAERLLDTLKPETRDAIICQIIKGMVHDDSSRKE
jgi:hypothetical protein